MNCLSVEISIYIFDIFQQSQEPENDDALSKLKNQAKMVSCRICKGDHWTTRCPYKDTLAPLQDKLTEVEAKKPEGTAAAGAAPAPGTPAQKTVGGKYVPPSLRDGARGRGESMQSNKRGEEGRGTQGF